MLIKIQVLVLLGIENNKTALWTLLLNTGYLTYTDVEQVETKRTYSLKFPNLEISGIYTDLIENIFNQMLADENADDLLTAFKEGDSETLTTIIGKYVANTMSGYEISENEPEKSYHLFALGLLATYRNKYKVKANKKSGYGRYDVVLIPKDKSNPPAIILEFKKATEKETLKSAATNGLNQIIKQKYATGVKELGFKQIWGYGIAFSGKRVFVKLKKL